jgi:Ca2+-binding RTX toxin-like protein
MYQKILIFWRSFNSRKERFMPNLSVLDATVMEGDSGSVFAVFQLMLDAPSTAPVSVNYFANNNYVKVPLATPSLSNGTSDPSEVTEKDYRFNFGTVTFMPGSTVQFVAVEVFGDTIPELTEQFQFNLNELVGADFANGDDVAIGYITDNDGTPPTATIDDVDIVEGNSGSQDVVFTVNLSQPSNGHITLFYELPEDDNEIHDADWYQTNRTVVFNPGETTKTITVAGAVTGNVIADGQRVATTVTIVNDNRNVKVDDYEAEAVIIDDDALPAGTPAFSINDISVSEGNSGLTNAVFTVTLSAPATTTQSVEYKVDRGSAILYGTDNDVMDTSGSLMFAPGQTSQTITVQVKGDTAIESNETFSVKLTGSESGTIISDRKGIGTIVNDDFLPPVQIIQPIELIKPPIGGPTKPPMILKANQKGDRLLGGEGDDQLLGGRGKDVMTGGMGADSFVLGIGRKMSQRGRGDKKAAIDFITDFVSGTDKIVLKRTEFPGLRSKPGFATVDTLKQAQKSAAQITYVKGSGALYFNQNGKGEGFGGRGGQFAMLENKPMLTVNDLVLG